MPCYHPIPASRDEGGRVQLGRPLVETNLQLPCGTCIGCRLTRAQHWALRCRLEAQDHEHTCVATLTYDDAFLPPTLQKRDFQLWMKRLRTMNRTRRSSRLRYFACGEYGERFGRPHYHAILFGVKSTDGSIDNAWQRGLTHTDNVSVEAINYVCNYTTKKLGWTWNPNDREERVDPQTGELFTWQPPFQLMSRRPGIGANAKKHYQSWALHAINNGTKLSVPRFYKSHYENTATPNEQEETEYQKFKYALQRHNYTEQELKTKEKLQHERQKLFSALRRYD